MDTDLLSRLQFALTTSFHFLFVTLTLGLALLVAVMETRYVRSGDARMKRMTWYWGRIYVINYAMGIVTGIVMEFQFGMNWNGLTHIFGNVFGAPLAMETLIAFFAESTFLGMWIFGWDRFPKRVHLALAWLVSLTAFASAYFILIANGFLHHPVGYVMQNGIAKITDESALLTNPFTLAAFGHIAAAALITAGMFMAGISAYQLRRRTAETAFFRSGLRTGIVTAGIGLLPSVGLGVVQFLLIAKYQPSKDAAFNDDPVKGAAVQHAMQGKFGAGNYVPSSGAVEHTGDAMMYIWVAVTVLVIIGLVLFRRGAIYRTSWFHRVLTYALPLPFVANICGWLFREIGRQPWTVYEVLTTRQAATPLSAGWVVFSLIAFMLLFATLATVDYLLIGRLARRGPDPEPVEGALTAEIDEPVVVL